MSSFDLIFRLDQEHIWVLKVKRTGPRHLVGPQIQLKFCPEWPLEELNKEIQSLRRPPAPIGFESLF